MDDLATGTRDKRGDYRPNAPLNLPSLGGFVRWCVGYVAGWNAVFFAITVLWWVLIVPPMSVMADLSWGWALRLLAANMLGIIAFFGVFELRYYVQRVQERRFKYNGKFPSEQASKVFWFQSQNIDNFLRTIFVTVPIGTAIEVLCLWAMASGAVAVTGNLWAIAALVLVAPIAHEAYFFFMHRGIHWGPLYKYVHSVHHNSINPSPWSSLSMHPVEGGLYFLPLAAHLLILSHPFLVIWQWNLAAFGALVGHIGFDKVEIGDKRAIGTHAYAHYLHHKYFEVNFCDDGALPWDKWFGTWHDGTSEGDRLMKERFQQNKARQRAANNSNLGRHT